MTSQTGPNRFRRRKEESNASPARGVWPNGPRDDAKESRRLSQRGVGLASRALHDGMTTVVGRIHSDSVLENGVKWVLLSHNTKLGAAKGAISVAEYLLHTGLV